MIHLHTKSCWSLLESPLRIEQIVQASIQAGQSYAVLTDHNTMFGTMSFLHACRQAGLRPVIGLEVHVTDPWDLHLILYAKDNQGLQNLYGLSSFIMTRENHTLHFEELLHWIEHCLVINGGQDELLLELTEKGQLERLAEIFEELHSSLETFYISAAMLDSSRHAASARIQKSLAAQLGIETVALSRVDYLREEDVYTVQMLQAIDRQTHLKDPALFFRYGRWWRSEQEMLDLYDLQDLEQTDRIARQIELDPDHLKTTGLPVYENKLKVSSEEYLSRLSRAGLSARLHRKVPALYRERLEHELQIINGMGFADYFLIVWDFIREARSRDILIGPGRGSAAGSLAAWCIGITHIDPIENGLLFERFLNPERISMPDIDTDIPDDRREEIISYTAQRYGCRHVAHIVTFSTFKAKMALRDAGRVLNVFAHDISRLTRLIGSQPDMTLSKIWQTSPEFVRLIRSKPLLQELYQTALKLEGLPRHTSIHAGGIVFSREDITRAAPLISCGSDMNAVQFTMEYLEEIGLIKFDLLGLKNLSVTAAINRQIEAQTGKALDLFRLPLDEPAVYQLLCSGQTLGVFQLESAGIRSLIGQFQPQNFQDIAAILALYRPGPMQDIGLYLDARRHPGHTQSLHPLLDPVLRETGGIFLYQEQIMQAAQLIGGFSLAQADSLRKAMSKKNRQDMERWRDKFLSGSAQRKIPQDQAAHIFEVMERFADYGFNKSHSYAYSLIVYWMAYMKALYPLEFYVCALQSVIGDKSKTADYLQECRIREIPILPLSINHSDKDWKQEKQGLRLPLGLIKGSGTQTGLKTEAERKARGPFTGLYEAIARLQAAGLNQAALKALIQSGAMDEFGYSRPALLENLDRLMQYGALIRVEQEEFLLNFEIASPPAVDSVPETAMQRSQGEFEALGLYISEHPAAGWRRHFPGSLPVRQALQINGPLLVVGRISSIHTHKTRNGQMMAFLSLEDETGRIDVAVMPDLYAREQLRLNRDMVLAASGVKNRKDSVLARELLYPSS